MKQISLNPKRMRKARIARGMTIKKLAEETGISRQMISNYELGKTVPQGPNILKIVRALNFPIEYFSSEDVSIIGGATFFRSQSAATKTKRDMQEVRIEFVKEVYDFLSTYVNFPQVELPDTMDKDVEEITEEYIKKIARELRNKWGIGQTQPIRNLIEIAEVHGIVVSEANMSDDKLDAVSKWIEGRPFILLTSNNESAVRRNFNVAHEIGHILLHESVESIHEYNANVLKNTIEKQANMFASHLLMPDDVFSDSLISTNLEFYVELKKYWNVSIQAMVMKAEHLGLISEDQKLYLNKKISWNKWRKKEPHDDIIPVEKPTLFSKVYKMIVDNGVISSADMVHQMKLPEDEISKILGVKIEGAKLYKENKKAHLRLVK